MSTALAIESPAAAEAAAAAGDWPAAIRLGTEANRAHRDPALEQSLARWRCRAFTRPTAAPPLPEAADPFPGHDGVPECQAADLTAALIAGAIAHHGSLLVRGLIAPAEAEQLRAGIDHTYAARAAYPEGGDPDGWYAPLRLPGDEGSRTFHTNTGDAAVLTADSPRMLFDFMEMFAAHSIVDVAAGALGERPALSVMKSTLRRTPPGRGGGWHQDGAFLGPVRALNVWLALTPCGRDAVGLNIIDRRIPYVVQTGTHGAMLDWGVGDRMLDILQAGGARVVNPEFAAGDALLFDHLMLHRTAVTPAATQTRYAIETWMFSPSSFPLKQFPLVL